MQSDFEKGEQLVANIEQASIIVTVVRVTNLIATNQVLLYSSRTSTSRSEQISCKGIKLAMSTILVKRQDWSAWKKPLGMNISTIIPDSS